MSYVALYRRWRPHTLSGLVGQEHISQTLTKAIQSGRISHAYLFSGPRGTGKTSTAKILAMALNCADGPTPEPCGKCDACRKVIDGSALDVFEIDAASNRGIDEIRNLRETVKFAPAEARYKVYIIDEVHMLTTEAFNALLKTLEEPPEHVVFILATTEVHKVPATIQSRCQRFDFHRITAEKMEAHMRRICNAMKVQADDAALRLVALQADGGLRDALSILDQCISLSGGRVTEASVQEMLGLVGRSWIYRLTKTVAAGKARDVLELVAELLRDGKDLRQIVAEFELHLRSLMVYRAAGSVEGIDLYAEPEEVLKKQSSYWESDALMQMISLLHECMQELRWSPQPRITVEVALLSLASGNVGTEDDLDARMTAAKEMEQEKAITASKIEVPASPVPETEPAPAVEPVPAPMSEPAPMIEAVPTPMPEPSPAYEPEFPPEDDFPSEDELVPPPVFEDVSDDDDAYFPPEDAFIPDDEPYVAAPDSIILTDDGWKLWQAVLQDIQSQKLFAVSACLQQARLAGFSASACKIEFQTETFAEVAKRICIPPVEQSLLRLSGNAYHLVCDVAQA